MNPAPLLDYFVAALDIASAAFVLCGACLALGCPFLGVGGRGGFERKEEVHQ